LGIYDFDIETNAYGKPYLKSGNIYFNLSHSEKRAMCVVSPFEVGCDTEKITDVDMEIPKHFFCPSEYEMLVNISDENERNDMFYGLWTLKESFVKLLGTGMKTPPNGFEISVNDGEISVLQNIDDRKYNFAEYDFNDGYKYAVCALSEKFSQPEFVALDFNIKGNREENYYEYNQKQGK
jgi:4'-phosphopantetheinyl transferase